MIINIIGLPRTGTTALYQTVFSGVNKFNKIFKYDKFLDGWDEPWICSKQDRGNTEFIKKLSLKIDEAIELGTTGNLVIKTHYGHLVDLKKYAPELYQKLFSIETYDIKIFRANLLETVISNIILNDNTVKRNAGQDFIYNVDWADLYDVTEHLRKIRDTYEIDEERFKQTVSGYIYSHDEMLANPLGLTIDEYVLYENLPKTIKGMWESLKISSDDRFKFDMDDNFDVATKKSLYKKSDIIKNYNRLKEIITSFDGEYGSMKLTDGVWTIKGIDF